MTTPHNSIVFIGNSHISQFDIDNIPNSYNISVDLLEFPGASIKGLLNNNSKTGLLQKINSYNFENKLAIFILGQCDVEFGYYYKSVQNGEKLEFSDFVEDLIAKYDSYLSNVNFDFVVLGINPCVVEDIKHNFRVNWNDDICFFENQINETGTLNSNLRFEDHLHIYNEDLKSRNDNHKFFNSRLRELCSERNYKFVDLYEDITENDIVLPEFKNFGLDHHLRKNIRLFDILHNKINLL